MSAMEKPRVAIVGAGASGLAMGKYIREFGGEPVIYERSSAAAGVWKFDKEGTDPGQPAYSALRANSSRKVMEFAYAPLASDDEFPARSEVEQYLAQYRDAHGLAACIRYGTAVRRVAPASRKWAVFTNDSARPEFFSHVVVCSGLYKVPSLPPLYGKAGTGFEVTHSSLFRSAAPYAGKRVLVAGLGNSGADIAVELFRAGAEVAVSLPRHAWIVPKHIDGLPYDHHLTSMTLRESIPRTNSAFEQLVLQEHARDGIDVERFRKVLAPQPLDLFRSRLTFNSEIARLVDEEKIRVLSAGEEIVADEFRDTCGRSFRFDAVVAATGYQRQFPFLEAACQPQEGNVLALYKHVFHPKAPGLAFLGACGVVGAIFPVVELQARWVAACFLGGRALPGSAEMARSVETHNYTASMNQIKPSRVIQVSYMETLALELGLGGEEDRRKLLPPGPSPVVADMYDARRVRPNA